HGEQKNCVIGPALAGNSRISAEPTAGFILAHFLPLDITAAISTSDLSHSHRLAGGCRLEENGVNSRQKSPATGCKRLLIKRGCLICDSAFSQSDFWWDPAPGTIPDHELLVFFLPDASQSVIVAIQILSFVIDGAPFGQRLP